MNGRTILMIGCRPQLLRAAREGGFSVVIVYGPWEKDWILPHPRYSEQLVLVDDPARVDLVLSGLARHGMRDRRFAAVCPASDEYVLPAAMLSTLLHTAAPAPAPFDTLAWKDKSLQKAAIGAAGIPVAAHQVIDDVLDDLPLPPDVPFPAVLKPIAGAGTAHTYIMDDVDSLRATVAALPADIAHRTFLLEEFVRGNELHVDGILYDGDLRFVSIGRYQQNLVNASKGSLIASTIVDPVGEADLYARVRVFAANALSALGVRAGVFHMEFFHTDDGNLIFGECGVRLPGVFIPQMVRRKFGVDLARAQLEILTGTAPTVEVELTHQAVSMLLLPTIPGSLRSCPSAADLMAQRNVEYAEIQKPVGAVLRSKEVVPTTRVGEILLVTEDAETADRRIEEITDWFTRRLRVVAEPDGPRAPVFRLWRDRTDHPLSAA